LAESSPLALLRHDWHTQVVSELIPSQKQTAAVIGGGPAGLMAADILSAAGMSVTVYDRMPSLGRKFLIAGRGGLNLTHSEVIERFLARYGEAAPHLRPAIEAFSPDDLRAFSESLGQPTFIGTSGRVFPKDMKSSPFLRAWLRKLDGNGVAFRLRYCWQGWTDDGALSFAGPDGKDSTHMSDVTVLALGGASWPKLGSDGGWAGVLQNEKIEVSPLRPANCGFAIQWTDIFRQRFAGQPLKRIALTHEGETIRGEAVIAHYGIEGGAVYTLSKHLRETIEKAGEAKLTVDLRPDMTQKQLAAPLGQPRGKQSLSTFLRKAASLSPPAIGLLQEAAAGKLGAMPAHEMADLIKAVPLTLTGTAPNDRAISTAGGVAFSEIDETFMLRKKPGVFIAGEMLDWEAPTGGYLLQACFATGAATGRGALAWLNERA
jgi:uncharacterized flavoprotein (TIGR03862 family)